MVNFDGYIVSHTYEPIMLPDEDEIRRYIPSKPLINRLSPRLAYSVGVVGPPEYYYEMKYQSVDAMDRSRQKIREIEADFNQIFKKDYKDINAYHMEDAEYTLLIMGSMTGTARVVAENLRRKGERAGVISIRWFRPFPFERLAEILEGVRAVGVIDRAVTSGGSSNPLFEDVASGLYGMKDRPVLQSFVAGLGGRDVPTDEFEMMFNKTKEAARAGHAGPCIYVGLRE